jgi:phosphoglycolate phosphatase
MNWGIRRRGSLWLRGASGGCFTENKVVEVQAWAAERPGMEKIMKTVSGVMFDLDGTLLDTLEDLGDAVNRMLADYGLLAHPYPFFRRAVGDGIVNLARRSLPEGCRDEATVAEATGKVLAYYAENWDAKTSLYPGVRELLAGVVAKGVPMAVLSNKPEEALQACVARFLADYPFVSVRGAREGCAIKPDPQGALESAAAVGIAPSAWLYVGDTNTDMQTATAAGMVAVGCTWGFRDREELVAAGAHVVIDEPTALLDLLGRSSPL